MTPRQEHIALTAERKLLPVGHPRYVAIQMRLLTLLHTGAIPDPLKSATHGHRK